MVDIEKEKGRQYSRNGRGERASLYRTMIPVSPPAPRSFLLVSACGLALETHRLLEDNKVIEDVKPKVRQGESVKLNLSLKSPRMSNQPCPWIQCQTPAGVKRATCYSLQMMVGSHIG